MAAGLCRVRPGRRRAARRFEGRIARRDAKPLSVVYYRTRDEYNQKLKSRKPQIEITLGVYFDQEAHGLLLRLRRTVVHYRVSRGTHQLFQEARSVSPNLGRQANFWIVEGIACTWNRSRQEDGFYVLGGTSGRMPAARYRLLEDNFYVPLGQFVRLGMENPADDPRIATLYSQAAGLTNF